MKRGSLAHPFAACLLLSALGLPAAPLAAQDSAKGRLVVGGQPVEVTHAYAYADKSFDAGKDVVVVLLSDSPVPSEAVQNGYARKKLVDAGTLHYDELLVDKTGKALYYEVQHQRFGMMMQPRGDDSDHVIEVKTLDGKTIAGRAHTGSPQQSPDDVEYSHDITFNARVAAAKQP